MNEVSDTLSEVQSGTTRMSRLVAFVELTKPRLTLLAVMTTLAGYYLGSEGTLDVVRLLQTLAATFLVGGGAAAANMYLEREQDARMKRTTRRPLPSARVPDVHAIAFGTVLAAGGVAWLSLSGSLVAALVALVTFVIYVAIYTPLKQMTSLNTIVGAIPGALPPLIGWSAATGSLSVGALALFALVFFWQMPHFLALAWMYRKDYARAGFVMLPILDKDGSVTARQTLMYTLALLPVSLVPTLIGISGLIYFFGAVLLGLIFAVLSARFLIDRSNSAAKAVFHFSLLYLPILLIVMIVDGPKF